MKRHLLWLLLFLSCNKNTAPIEQQPKTEPRAPFVQEAQQILSIHEVFVDSTMASLRGPNRSRILSAGDREARKRAILDVSAEVIRRNLPGQVALAERVVATLYAPPPPPDRRTELMYNILRTLPAEHRQHLQRIVDRMMESNPPTIPFLRRLVDSIQALIRARLPRTPTRMDSVMLAQTEFVFLNYKAWQEKGPERAALFDSLLRQGADEPSSIGEQRERLVAVGFDVSSWRSMGGSLDELDSLVVVHGLSKGREIAGIQISKWWRGFAEADLSGAWEGIIPCAMVATPAGGPFGVTGCAAGIGAGKSLAYTVMNL